MKLSPKINKFMEKVDNFAPNPWIIDGVKQVRPAYQFAFFCGIIVGLILLLILL